VFNEEVLPVFDGLNFAVLNEGEILIFQGPKGCAELFFQLIKLGKVGGGSFDDSLSFVGSTPLASAGADAHGGFDRAFPVLFFTPTREAEASGHPTGKIDDFSRGVPS